MINLLASSSMLLAAPTQPCNPRNCIEKIDEVQIQYYKKFAINSRIDRIFQVLDEIRRDSDLTTEILIDEIESQLEEIKYLL